jgi:lysophospholipase L1-like esterase
MKQHVVLLGDSIFDNAAYVQGGRDVITHLRDQISPEWDATLSAVDGSVTRNVSGQLRNVPSGATHFVVSVGGNDALQRSDILGQRAQTTAEVLNQLADIADEFQAEYSQMLRAVLKANLPTCVCTVYYPRFPEPTMQKITVAALTVFNDVIIREAFAAGLPLLDLRLICDDDADYANPIEPSDPGGKKIAAAISRMLREHSFEKGRTEVFAS